MSEGNLRLARAVRERFAPDPALVERGRADAHVGAAAMAMGLGLQLAVLASVATPPLAAVGSFVLGGAALVAGVLGSSRIARALAVGLGALSGATVAAVALGTATAAPALGPVGIAGSIAASVLFAGGAWKANLTRAARAWHQARLDARAARRRPASLARWRARDDAEPPLDAT